MSRNDATGSFLIFLVGIGAGAAGSYSARIKEAGSIARQMSAKL